MILGDFNARVGSRDPMEEEDHWEKSRGPHGFGEMNDAGKELLSFLSLNEATVCNTWFQKMPISAPGNTLSQRGGTVSTTPSFVQEKGDALMPALSEALSAIRTISYSALSCTCLSCIKQQRQPLTTQI